MGSTSYGEPYASPSILVLFGICGDSYLFLTVYIYYTRIGWKNQVNISDPKVESLSLPSPSLEGVSLYHLRVRNTYF